MSLTRPPGQVAVCLLAQQMSCGSLCTCPQREKGTPHLVAQEFGWQPEESTQHGSCASGDPKQLWELTSKTLAGEGLRWGWEAEIIQEKGKSVLLEVKSARISFLKELRKLKKTSVSSTFLTATNAKKVWVRLTEKFNLKPSSKKNPDWSVWNGLSWNTTVYSSSPKGWLFSSSLGFSKNYFIWEENTSVGTWALRRITSPDTFLEVCIQPQPPWSLLRALAFAPQPQHRLCFSFSTHRNPCTCKIPQDQILKARIN